MVADLSQATTTTLRSSVPNFSVTPKTIEDARSKGYEWCNPNWSKYLGYYKKLSALKQRVDSLAMWTAGRGYEADEYNQSILDNIQGWGEDSFDSLMQMAIVIKKINGDAYLEIVRNDAGTLINLKPLNPARIKTIVEANGM